MDGITKFDKLHSHCKFFFAIEISGQWCCFLHSLPAMSLSTLRISFSERWQEKIFGSGSHQLEEHEGRGSHDECWQIFVHFVALDAWFACSGSVDGYFVGIVCNKEHFLTLTIESVNSVYTCFHQLKDPFYHHLIANYFLSSVNPRHCICKSSLTQSYPWETPV